MFVTCFKVLQLFTLLIHYYSLIHRMNKLYFILRVYVFHSNRCVDPIEINSQHPLQWLCVSEFCFADISPKTVKYFTCTAFYFSFATFSPFYLSRQMFTTFRFFTLQFSSWLRVIRYNVEGMYQLLFAAIWRIVFSLQTIARSWRSWESENNKKFNGKAQHLKLCTFGGFLFFVFFKLPQPLSNIFLCFFFIWMFVNCSNKANDDSITKVLYLVLRVFVYVWLNSWILGAWKQNQVCDEWRRFNF